MAYGYMIFSETHGAGRVYFGITSKSISSRWKEHVYESLTRSKQYLHRAMKKYGVENFHVQQMFEHEDIVACKQWEIDTIKSSRKIGLKLYNLTDGGDGCAGYKMSDAEKQKLSKRMMGHTLSADARKRIADARRGVPRSPETLAKMAIASTGVPCSESARRKISEALRGIVRSEETRQKMREAWAQRKAGKLAVPTLERQ